MIATPEYESELQAAAAQFSAWIEAVKLELDRLGYKLAFTSSTPPQIGSAGTLAIAVTCQGRLRQGFADDKLAGLMDAGAFVRWWLGGPCGSATETPDDSRRGRWVPRIPARAASLALEVLFP